MDWRLVSFVFSLPEDSKIGGGFTKHVLREAMRDVMPEELRTRKSKIGFSSPLPDWFNGPLRDWIWQQVNESDFLQSDVWDASAIQSFVKERRLPGTWKWEDATRVWPFIHAHLWLKIFLKNRRD